MLAASIFARTCKATGSAAFFSVIALSAAPALANSSASADIVAPLRIAAADAAAHTAGDREFRQLFTSWRALDGGFARPAASAASVSIPSRIPLDGVRLTSDYGMRWHPVIGGRHMHKGIDLAGAIGTPVHAAADGTIGRADWFSSYGLYVAIEHGGDLETRYGHMSRLNVAAGQFVHKGDVIGFVGRTGRATGPHLHYEVRVAGEAVNPMPYMQAAGAAQLVDADASARSSSCKPSHKLLSTTNKHL